jgi:AraC-like DNA-binding protein
VELHFDIYNDKASFSGSQHRSIRFGPMTRSNCFTVSLNDSGFKVLDSINVLISREMKWSKSFVSSGFIIEVSIPFFVLSDIQYPQKQIGFDISSTNIDSGVPGQTFTSWAGSSNSEHYNPSQWGTAILSQAMFPLRFAILAGLIFFSLCIAILVFLLIRQHYKEHKYEQAEENGYSDLMKSIIDMIDKTIAEKTISQKTIAKQLSVTIEKINATIYEETGSDFSVLLQFRRIVMAKRLLRETDHTLDIITLQTGFKSPDIFCKDFVSLTGVEPDKYRQRAREELEEEED